MTSRQSSYPKMTLSRVVTIATAISILVDPATSFSAPTRTTIVSTTSRPRHSTLNLYSNNGEMGSPSTSNNGNEDTNAPALRPIISGMAALSLLSTLLSSAPSIETYHPFQSTSSAYSQSSSSTAPFSRGTTVSPLNHINNINNIITIQNNVNAYKLFRPPPAQAYEESDYASETVTSVVRQLKESTGDADATFKVLEEMAAIITEGKGVGGSLSYSGVKLSEGYVADEDTTIYNPGLTLLTQSEKERLVSSIIQNRQSSLKTNAWSPNNEYAFEFLKQKLDPLHMYELEGYLGILPFYGAAVYLAAIFAQQNLRGIFPLAYGVCALAVFGPIVLLVVKGP